MGDDRKKSRGARMNPRQKSSLIQLMEDYPVLATGQISASFTYQDQQAVWDYVTQELNKLGPPRDKAKWKKSWQDLRSDAKGVAGKLNASVKKTGGGEGVSYDELSPNKQKIISMCGGRTMVEGHATVAEFGTSSHAQRKRNIALVDTDTEDEDDPPLPQPLPAPLARASSARKQDSSVPSCSILAIAKAKQIQQQEKAKKLQQVPAEKQPVQQKHQQALSTPQRIVSAPPVPKEPTPEVHLSPYQIRLASLANPKTPTPTKSDTVIKLQQNELAIWEAVSKTLAMMNALLERFAQAQEQNLSQMTVLLERSAQAQELTASTLLDLVNFVLKKK